MSFIIRDYNPKLDAKTVFDLASKIFSFSSLFYCETLADFEKYQGFVIQTQIDGNRSITETRDFPSIDGFILFSKFNSTLYIDFLATNVEKKGYGSALLHHFITYCDIVNLPCYLHIEKVNDVYTKRLSEWYAKFGFIESTNILFPLYESMEPLVKTMIRD